MRDIVCALEECEKLKKTADKRSDGKRIFGDLRTTRFEVLQKRKQKTERLSKSRKL
jgi:hypothetical protein